MAGELQFQDVTYRYPRSRQPALACVSASLEAGKAVALVGHNGSGKSTLCKVLNGMLAGAGSISLGGQRITPGRLPGHHIAYAFQNPNDQLFLLTVRQELAFGPQQVGMSRAAVDDAVAFALDLFGLDGVADAHPLDLPFVLRKRVGLAATVAMRRPWTVLDEPTLGQGPGYCDHLVAVSRKLLDLGYNLILISHHADFVFAVCERVLVMAGGKCTWQGSSEEFLRRPPAELADFVDVAGRLQRDGIAVEVYTRR